MDDFAAMQSDAVNLAHAALGAYAFEYGITVASRNREGIPLLAHDEREAPYVEQDPSLLVSLTDEEDVVIYLWARPHPTSRVVGIGVDLAATSDFAKERGSRFNHLLFSTHEQAFVRQHYADRPEVGYAYAFSAKEAAFKSLAAPLRTWYRTHNQELVFEVREFELADARHERGTLRHAAAQDAIDCMGIRTINLSHCEMPELNAVLTIAIAIAQS